MKVIRYVALLIMILWLSPAIHAEKILSKAQFSELYSVADKPDIAYQWLDSVRRVSISDNYQHLAKFQVDYIEAFIASRQFESEHAINVLNGLLKDPAVENNSEILLSVYLLLINEYMIQKNYSLSLYYIFKSIKLEKDEAIFPMVNLYTAVACIFLDLQLMEQAHEYIALCHKLLDEEESKANTNWGQLLIWRLHVYESELFCYYQERNYQKMEEIAYMQSELVYNISPDKFKSLFWNEEEADTNSLQQLSLAVAQIHQGKKKEALSNFRIAERFLIKYPEKLEKSKTFLFLDYYIEADSLERSMAFASKLKEHFYTNTDTINQEYTSLLSLQAHLYTKLGNYKEAALIMQNVNTIKSKLLIKMKVEFPQEMKYLCEAINQDIILYHENTNYKFVIIRLLFTIFLFPLLFFFFYKYRRYTNSIQMKELKILTLEKECESNNLILDNIIHEFQQLKVLYMYRSSHNISQDQAVSLPAVTSKRDLSSLFSRLKRLMDEQQLFLDPDISREKVSQILSTNKQYLSEAITQHTGLTFTNYIVAFRLSYACNLLLHTSDTIESVASQSGFSSARTFYRLFRQKTGVSPTQFRLNHSVENE